MPVVVQVRARKAFKHHGRSVRAGEVLSIAPVEGAALVYQGQASFVTGAGHTTKRKRTYQRRDLQAEE